MASSERHIGWTALVGVSLSLGLNGWLSVMPAAAQPSQEQQSAIRSNCRSDFMSRCSGVQPGGTDALRCLQRNSAQLSPNCRRAVAALGGPAPAAAPTVATAAPAAAPTLASAPSPEQQNAIKFTCRRDFMTN